MKVLQTANLGKTLGGNASNVRYSVYDTLGSVKTSATNAGVYELGSSTGIYGVELNLDQKFARYIHSGRWKIDKAENQMTFYQDDNITEIAKYDLLDDSGSGSVTQIFERKLVGTGSI